MRQRDVPNSFATLQVLSDLRSVMLNGVPSLAKRVKTLLKPTLEQVVFERGGRMSGRPDDAFRAEILLIAALPEKGFDAFLAATALLLSDHLQDGAGSDELSWNWDTFRDSYRRARPPVRAALMNGFRRAHVTHRLTLHPPPGGRDLYTCDEQQLLQRLRRIALTLSARDRDAICALVQDGTEQIHHRALDNCLATSCVLSEFGVWFPGEVVLRASRDRRHPGFSGVMALLLIDAILTRDAGDRMARRWEEHADDFSVLAPEIGAPLIAGVRHLHEMGFDWRPYAGWPSRRVAEKAIVVPVARA